MCTRSLIGIENSLFQYFIFDWSDNLIDALHSNVQNFAYSDGTDARNEIPCLPMFIFFEHKPSVEVHKTERERLFRSADLSSSNATV